MANQVITKYTCLPVKSPTIWQKTILDMTSTERCNKVHLLVTLYTNNRKTVKLISNKLLISSILNMWHRHCKIGCETHPSLLKVFAKQSVSLILDVPPDTTGAAAAAAASPSAPDSQYRFSGVKRNSVLASFYAYKYVHSNLVSCWFC